MKYKEMEKKFRKALKENPELYEEEYFSAYTLGFIDYEACSGDGKSFTFTSEEGMSLDWMKEKIFVQNCGKYRVDEDALAEFILSEFDKNLLNSVSLIAFVNDDAGLRTLYDQTGDECILDVIDMEKFVGLFWFQQNAVIVNMALIEKLAAEIADADENTDEITEVWYGVIATLAHELCHVMASDPLCRDFVPALSKEEEEDYVEEYARAFSDAHPPYNFNDFLTSVRKEK